MEPKRERGRPREFVEDQVLDNLVELFWERGFEATSLADIVAATGVNKSSLYAIFGTKEEMFLRALDRYIEDRAHRLQSLVDGDRGLDDLMGFLELQRSLAMSPEGRLGCMAVNSMSELGLRSEQVSALTERHRSRLRQATRTVLLRAAANGEIPADRVDDYAEAMLIFYQSLVVVARAGAGAEEINTHIDTSRRLVEGWRLPVAT